MPMAGQNPVLDRAPVKRKTKMRATVLEREDTVAVVDDEQWTHTPTDDAHPPRLQLLQRPDADPLIGRMIVTRLAHRPSLRRYWATALAAASKRFAAAPEPPPGCSRPPLPLLHSAPPR